MVAVDTNVVVRFLTHDDPKQAARAAALFKSKEIWVAKTVLVETQWVLRSLYRFTDERIARALRALAGLPNVHLEDAEAVAQAMEWWNRGLDFADALHLASRGGATSFVTFDEKFLKRALRAGVGEVATP